MSYAILAVVIAILAGAVASLVLWSMLAAEKAKLAPLQTQVADCEKAKNDAILHAQEQQERLEAIIEGLKKEVATIEAQLQTCRDPAVIRDRLRGLLGSVQAPVPVPAASGGAYGTVPYGGTPKP